MEKFGSGNVRRDGKSQRDNIVCNEVSFNICESESTKERLERVVMETFFQRINISTLRFTVVMQ